MNLAHRNALRGSVALAAMFALTGALPIVPGVDTSDYPWVGQFGDAGGFDTTAVAVSPHWVMTARHTTGGMGSTDALFKLQDGTTFSSVEIVRHPTDDIALVRMSDSMPGWYKPYFGAADLGATMTIVGYGVKGRMAAGEWEFDWGTGGVKRFARNRATLSQFLDLGSVRAWWLIADFDGAGRDAFGDGGPVSDEGTLGAGDSGSAALIDVAGEWEVAGIGSWIGSVGGGQPPPHYGSIFGAVQVRKYEAWIRSIVPETVLLDSFTIIRGLLLSGGLPDLFFSDDSRLVVRTAVFAPSIEPPVQIEVVGTSPTESPSELRFRFEGTASRDLIQRRISMYNYVTQSYEELHVAFAATSDEVVEIVITS
ncbi:MAG: hypothetical protein IH851_11940, partial [Armatimonadetes bacterium]|nr:hypothetical protein [Armatimonadota bacterium]